MRETEYKSFWKGDQILYASPKNYQSDFLKIDIQRYRCISLKNAN